MTHALKRVTIGCALGLAAACPARADLLSNWNVVTTGDLYAAGTVQGAVRVGGTLNVQNGFDVARLSGSPLAANPSLLVGGGVKTASKNPETIKVAQGNAVIGGTINGAANNDARIVSAQKGTVKFDAAASKVAEADAKELAAVSSAFRSMESTKGTVYMPSGQVDTAKFTVQGVDSNGNAVFDVDGAKLFSDSLVRGVTLDLNGYKFEPGRSVIFNVSGDDIAFRGGLNFDGAFRTSAANIIWNFYGASSIDLNRGTFAGALLAPEATVRNTGNLSGSIYAGSIGNGYGNGLLAGVQAPLYAGYDPSKIAPATTPEPSSIVLIGIALASGVAFKARRRRVA